MPNIHSNKNDNKSSCNSDNKNSNKSNNNNTKKTTIMGLYRYYGVHISTYWDNGKENGNYYNGLYNNKKTNRDFPPNRCTHGLNFLQRLEAAVQADTESTDAEPTSDLKLPPEWN